jgi:hypothetical protein
MWQMTSGELHFFFVMSYSPEILSIKDNFCSVLEDKQPEFFSFSFSFFSRSNQKW